MRRKVLAAGSTRVDKPPVPREIYVLIAAAGVIAIGFGLIAPIIPQFAKSFEISDTQAAFVISAFALFRLAFAPVSGRLVSGWGERPTYIAGLLIVALSTGACAFADSYLQLLVFRALGGIGSTMFTVSAMGLLVRLAPPTIRGRVTSMYAGAFIIGTMMGPLLGGVLGRFGLRLPFMVYAVGLLIAAAIVWLQISGAGLREGAKAANGVALSVGEAARDRAYRSAVLSAFVGGWTNFGVRIALVPIFILQALDLGPFFAGLAMTLFAIGNAGAVAFSGSLSDRIGRRPLLISGHCVCGGATLAFGFSTSLVWVVALSIVAGFGTGLLFAPLQAAVADIVGANRNGGKVIALQQMAQDFGAIIGPIVGGLMSDHGSYELAFGITGAMMLAAAVVWLFTPETHPQKKS